MRWLLLKDLQILRRSPLLVALLVLYPIVIAVLIGFALSRGPDKPRVAFLNQVPQTANEISLGGEADFHALEYRHDRANGLNTMTGQLLFSDDLTTRTELSRIAIADFAVSPDDPDVLVVTTEEGPALTDDGGGCQADDGDSGEGQEPGQDDPHERRRNRSGLQPGSPRLASVRRKLVDDRQGYKRKQQTDRPPDGTEDRRGRVAPSGAGQPIFQSLTDSHEDERDRQQHSRTDIQEQAEAELV
jgi:hypothetical protein